MSAEIIAALIGAGGVVVAAIIGLIRRPRVSPDGGDEEAARRSEQVRVKATQAGEALMKELAAVIRLAEEFEGFLAGTGATPVPPQVVAQYVAPISQAYLKIKRLMYETTIYITPEIRRDVEESFAPLTAPQRVELANWPEFVEHLRQSQSKIADHFKNTYLRTNN